MRPGWNYYLRLAAAAVLVACLFLPLSTCTNRGQTTITVPIHDMKPVVLALLVFCGPLLFVVAEVFRPRASNSGLVLVAVQIGACVLSAYQIYGYTLFYTPAIGWYLSLGSLLTIFVAAAIEIVLRVRMRRRHDRRDIGLTLSS